MKVVLTLIARDEADVVETQLRYHLERDVDFVIATDHASADRTTEILRTYERDGVLRLIREGGEAFRQSEWVTRMARLAATDHGADWVLNSDADEFWWPRGGASLKDVLSAVPARFGVVRAPWRNFVLRPDTDEPFEQRMIVRRRPDPDVASPYHVQVKVAHRADPHVVVPRGNHDALGERLLLIREWFPIEVLHFPIRSREQLLRKYSAPGAYEVGADPRVPRHTAAMAALLDAQGDALYRKLLVDDEQLRRGLDDGTFRVDTRLRDALRGLDPPEGTLADDVDLAEDAHILLEHDSAHRLQARIGSFERRLDAVCRPQRARA